VRVAVISWNVRFSSSAMLVGDFLVYWVSVICFLWFI